MTIETERFMTVKIHPGKHCQFCEVCGSNSPMLTTTEAEQFSRMSSLAIFRLIEAGRIHSRETAASLLLVCFNSLSAEKSKQQSIKEQKL